MERCALRKLSWDRRAITELKTSLHFRIAQYKEQVQDHLPTTTTSDLLENKMLARIAHTCLPNTPDKKQQDVGFGVNLKTASVRLAWAT